MDFKLDLAKGEAGEVEVADFLKKMGFEILNFNKNMDYDILAIQRRFASVIGDRLLHTIPNQQYTFEIKTDEWEHYHEKVTNNMFIEISCNGKPSGIAGSKSDFFIYYFPKHETLYAIERKKLIKELYSMGGIRSSQSGDGGRVLGYLINKTEPEVLQHFWKYKKNVNGDWLMEK